MKKLLSNDYLILLGRIVLGLMFLVASIDKIADPGAFASSISNYRLVPPVAARVIATVLPWTELLCAFGVLSGISLRGSSLLCSAMLSVFTVAVLIALARGLDISCGCFTQDPSAERIGAWKVAENALLLLISLMTYFSLSIRFSLEHYFSRRSPERQC